MVDGARLLALRVRVPGSYRHRVVHSSPRQSSGFFPRRGDILETTVRLPRSFCSSDWPRRHRPTGVGVGRVGSPLRRRGCDTIKIWDGTRGVDAFWRLPDRKRQGHVTMTPWTVRWARIGAMLLLAAICADVTNVHCDASVLSFGGQGVVGAASQSNGGDACATICVADCFCCSRTEQASVFDLRPRVEPPAPCAVGGFSRPASGIRPIPYHPPLNLL